MPQYTSTATSPGGTTVNTVLDTGLNTITITVTTPAGTVATTTFDATVTDLINPVVALRDQLSVAEPTLSRTDLSSGVRNATISTVNDVKNQATSASTIATATDTTVPAAPNPPVPVAASDNPNPTPNPDVVVTPVLDTPTATITYYENNGTTGNETVYPQLTAEELALAAQGNAEAGPGEISYQAPPVDDTVYYESNGTSSTSVPFPQLTAEELALAAQGDAGAGPGEVSYSPSSSNAIGVVKAATQATATNQDSASFQKAKDWRVRISLAPSSNYLYNAPDPGILAPLSAKTGTGGVIFPYTPNVTVAYAAGYDPTEIAHSNYKVFQYKGSSVDSISITGDFTAQDTNEANYMLAVIHFFRSVTKMFYGQDQNPKNGVPPPLCYLSGFGTYQFDNHPMAITNFTYTTPTDVDYIRAGSQTNMPGQSTAQQTNLLNSVATAASAIRLLTSNLTVRAPNFQTQNSAINSDATYVPTKISISITALPVVTRNDISNTFSLEKYATGQLLQGSKLNGGGIW